jgi:hypothetical protein
MKDEWDEIHYSGLTEQENQDIRTARRCGFATFFPPDDEGEKHTLAGAREFLGAHF